MPILKTKQRDLVVGQFYLAYSAQSKMLSSNGTNGIIVQYVGEKNGNPEVKVWRSTGTTRNMSIVRLDERKDAFMIEFTEEVMKELVFNIGQEGDFKWPKYTERMKEAKRAGVELKLQSIIPPQDRFPEERIDGTLTLVMTTQHDGVDTYLNNFQVSVKTDVMQAVCTAEELEEKKRQEEMAKIEKLKEGGVRLTVGKMELGQKVLPDILKYRQELMEDADEYSSNNATFMLLYGKEIDQIKKQYTR